MSDEQHNEGAPDGEIPHDRADGNGELARVIQQRDQHKQAARERDQELATVRAELEQLRSSSGAAAQATPDGAAQTPSDDDTDKTPAWASKLIGRIDALEGSVTGSATKRHRDELMSSVIGQVPDGNRANAELTILGLEAKGLIKLDTDGTADAVISAIHTHNPDLFRDGRRRNVRLPPQVNATGAVDWSAYNSVTEVPKNLLADVPDAEWARLNKTGEGAGSRPLRL